MTVTVSAQVMVQKAFDKFYQKMNDISFQSFIEIMGDGLQDLEEACSAASTSQYSTEYEEAYKDGFEVGASEGRKKGFKDGVNYALKDL